jgi:hypothetical protein
MKTELAINWEGTVVTVMWDVELITLTKGEQFEQEMASTTGVIIDGKDMTLAAAQRKWMHDKLDNWIDGLGGE